MREIPMRFSRLSAIAFAMLAFFQSATYAVTIDVSNLSNTPTGKTSYSPSNNQYMSTMFRTTAFAGTADSIASITLRLQNESGASITNAQVYIYTSTANNIVSSRRPNTLVPNAIFTANISATNPNGSGSLTYQDVMFNPTSSIVLAANTSYWVVFMSTPADKVNWLNYNTASNVVGTNVAINPFAATSTTGLPGSWTGISSLPNQFEITTVPVPEPSTYALAAISAGLLGFYGRRKKSVKSAE